jgi:putative FmdB family regulatory protein
MPTYVYACDACGTQFEKFQSFKEEPINTCPSCSQEKVRRVFQPVGIVFKGSGWYITDNRGDNASMKHSKNSQQTESKENTETKTESTKTESSSSDSGTSQTSSDSSSSS